MHRAHRPSLTSAAALIGGALLLLAGPPPRHAGANRFTPVGGPEGGTVIGLAATTERVWASTQNAGLFTSTDGTASWTAVIGTIASGGSGTGPDPSWAQGRIAALA